MQRVQVLLFTQAWRQYAWHVAQEDLMCAALATALHWIRCESNTRLKVRARALVFNNTLRHPKLSAPTPNLTQLYVTACRSVAVHRTSTSATASQLDRASLNERRNV